MHGQKIIKLKKTVFTARYGLGLCVQFRLILVFKELELVAGARGGVVVKALCYKPAGRGFDSRWCHWNFSVT